MECGEYTRRRSEQQAHQHSRMKYQKAQELSGAFCWCPVRDSIPIKKALKAFILKAFSAFCPIIVPKFFTLILSISIEVDSKQNCPLRPLTNKRFQHFVPSLSQ
jgi:hypothetical protein